MLVVNRFVRWHAAGWYPTVGYRQRSPLPERLARPLRPLPVICFTADRVLAHTREDFTWRRQRLRIDTPVRIPELGAHDGAGALEVDHVDLHHDDRARRIAFRRE